MSSSKRRKICSKSGKESLNTFRLSITETVSEKSWENYIRKKVEVRKTFRGKLQQYFDKYIVPGRMHFDDYTKKERMELLLEIPKEKLEFRLDKCLRSQDVGLRRLRNLYEDYIAPHGTLSRDIIVKSLISKFIGDELDLRKRSNEKSIISDADFTNIFVTLSNVTIPKHILEDIFSFLKYDSDFLVNVGGVSKDFYITVLSTWPSIVITKRKLYLISLLVLRSVKMVIFNVSLTPSELKYLLDHLNGDGVRSVVFKKYSNQFTRTFFQYLTEKQKQNPSFFHGVARLHFLIDGNSSFNLTHLREKIKPTCCYDWKGVDLSLKNIFPNLRVVENPILLSSLNGLKKLKTLKIPTRKSFGVEYFHPESDTRNCMNINTSTLIVHRRINASGGGIDSREVKRILGKIGGVENLVFCQSMYFRGSDNIDFSFISDLKELKELTFSLHVGVSRRGTFDKHSVSLPSTLVNLRVIDVRFSHLVSPGFARSVFETFKKLSSFTIELFLSEPSISDIDNSAILAFDLIREISSEMNDNIDDLLIKVSTRIGFFFTHGSYENDNFLMKYEKKSRKLEIGCFERYMNKRNGKIMERKMLYRNNEIGVIIGPRIFRKIINEGDDVFTHFGEFIDTCSIFSQDDSKDVQKVFHDEDLFGLFEVLTPGEVEETMNINKYLESSVLGRHNFRLWETLEDLNLYENPGRVRFLGLFHSLNKWRKSEEGSFGKTYHQQRIQETVHELREFPFLVVERVFRKK